jgi:hypothetical protein
MRLLQQMLSAAHVRLKIPIGQSCKMQCLPLLLQLMLAVPHPGAAPGFRDWGSAPLDPLASAAPCPRARGGNRQ